MSNVDNPPENHKSQPADPTEVFRARCWARALLVEEGVLDFDDSMMVLYSAALDYGLLDRDDELAETIVAEEFGL
jgi:hypothetical protein